MYDKGLLKFSPLVPSSDDSGLFWQLFNDALNTNKRGSQGKVRILSIIAENFRYTELYTKLQVSKKANQI